MEAKIAVAYLNTKYRIHASTCRDLARDVQKGFAVTTYDAGTTLAEIAASEFSDFIYEDPEYYTPEVTLNTFAQDCDLLECSEHVLGAPVL
jgi:hypothetical protein